MHAAVFAPFLYAVIIPLVMRILPRVHPGWFVLPLPVVITAYIGSLLPDVRQGDKVETTLRWIPSLGINLDFYADGLSLLFALLIAGIGSLIVLYSIYYMDKEERLGNFYIYLLVFMGAMLGIVLSDNLIVLYVFWELTSVASFLLIGFWYHKEKARYGAQKAVFITVAGGFAMLGGFVLLSLIGDTFSIRELVGQREALVSSSLYLPALALILIGAFTKSAQFPFHIWLPDAMVAPTPVSAYLHSATMVKAGLYLVARLSPALSGTPAWVLIISSVGMVTLFWGAFMAVRQIDLKSILAFSTISQLGLIMALLGFNTDLAAVAAVFHLLNHSTFKGGLFMVTGIIDHKLGTRNIHCLSGLFSAMPISAAIMLVTAFAMAGIPPLSGFLSKEMFFAATLEVSSLEHAFLSWFELLLPGLAVAASIFTFMYSMILFFNVFRGPLRLENLAREPSEAPVGMLVSPLALTAIVIVIGLAPSLVAGALVAPAAEAITLVPQDVKIAIWHGINLPLFMTLLVIGLGVLAYRRFSQELEIYTEAGDFTCSPAVFDGASAISGRLSLNYLYDRVLEFLARASSRLTAIHMTGLFRDYLIYLMLGIIVIVGYALVSYGGLDFGMQNLAPVTLYEFILVGVLVAAAFATAVSDSRLAAIISLGVVGFIVAALFVFFGAPDLALTQLVIETVSVALFLLCFYHLPELKKDRPRPRTRLFSISISAAVGALFAAIAFSAHNSKLFAPISSYYIERAYELGGGKNIVNVILVDFRGLDTMLEILVIAIAALGVYAVIKLRPKGREQGED